MAPFPPPIRELSGLYLHTVTETKLIVDTSRGETLRINFDITFPALACSILSVDAMDISGELHLDVKHDIIKRRLVYNGNTIEARQDGIAATKIEKPLQKHGGRLEHNETYCGSCYGVNRKSMTAIDPDYYENLKWMLEHDISDVLDLSFSIDGVLREEMMMSAGKPAWGV